MKRTDFKNTNQCIQFFDKRKRCFNSLNKTECRHAPRHQSKRRPHPRVFLCASGRHLSCFPKCLEFQNQVQERRRKRRLAGVPVVFRLGESRLDLHEQAHTRAWQVFLRRERERIEAEKRPPLLRSARARAGRRKVSKQVGLTQQAEVHSEQQALAD